MLIELNNESHNILKNYRLDPTKLKLNLKAYQTYTVHHTQCLKNQTNFLALKILKKVLVFPNIFKYVITKILVQATDNALNLIKTHH